MAPEHTTEQLDRVVLRFAGDSGDGMQLTGDRFTTSSALFGNDLSTFPDFPAEIRAPAGTLAGVSAFQVHISDHDILTPGDAPNVLVAMNPAALRANIGALPKSATLIVNADAFDERNLTKAGYDANPLTDGSLGIYTVYEVPMTSITQEVCKEAGVKPRDAERSKNFFALGLVSWLYTRPMEPTLEWIEQRFSDKPQVAEANRRAFRAGFDFGETAELFESNYEVRPASFAPGEYVNITGNTALAWGLIVAANLAGLPLFLGSYPITPASDILHELSRRKEFGVRTFQAEDEISGVGAALGAAFGGSLGVTTTSGPGLDLKSETLGLAINLELPLLVVDIQRGGPSTGLPTKTEQADLLHAMYGRHGESPLPIVASMTPAHCFEMAIEAVRLAVKYRTPVILLSDGYLANGAEPWRLPDLDALSPIDPGFASEPNHVEEDGDGHLLALRARRGDPRPAVGPPGRARPRAPDRRHRESRRQRERLLRPGQPRADGPSPGGQDRRHRPGHPAGGGGRRDRRRRRAGDRLGLDLRIDRRRGAAGAGTGPPGRPGPPGPPQPLPGQPGRGGGPVPESAGARSEHGTAEQAAAGGVLDRCPAPEQGPGRAVPGRRDRGCHPRTAGRRVMTDTAIPVTTRKDWTSDQEVRWCPGCGDYSILAAVQMLLPDLGVRRESTVFLSGIGCAARFPYYMNTYGLHSIHGRAPAIATGLATTRPDLDIWVVTGDGDALSIGGNHLIHALRRNVRMTILMFNNQIYGLTKGQYSPTSEVAKITKSTPFGSVDAPFNPVSLAIGAEASFVARTHDMDRAHMQETFRRAHAHDGAAFVEVYQNCNVFNDGAFADITAKDVRSSMLIPLAHGEPIRFGADLERGVVQRSDGRLEVVDVAAVGEDALLIHDESRDGPGPGLRPVPAGQRPA